MGTSLTNSKPARIDSKRVESPVWAMASSEKNGSAFQDWIEQHRWFMEHYRNLARRYDGQNVCVYKNRIVDHDKDLRKLMKRVQGKFPQDRVLVEFVTRTRLKFVLATSLN
jgi:hypothetical protein